MRLQLEEAEEFLVFPADTILHLKIDAITVQDKNGTNGPYKSLNFAFVIQGIQVLGADAPHPAEAYQVMVGSKIFGSTSATFTTSPNNRLRQWVEAILGMELSPGFDLDTDLLVGRKVRGVTSIWTGTKVDVATGKVKSGHQIAALLPSGANSAPQVAPQAAPAQQWAGTQDPWATQQPASSTNPWDSAPF